MKKLAAKLSRPCIPAVVAKIRKVFPMGEGFRMGPVYRTCRIYYLICIAISGRYTVYQYNAAYVSKAYNCLPGVFLIY